jgi:hypothetical protein
MARRIIRITVETIRIAVKRTDAAPVDTQAEAECSSPEVVPPEPPENQHKENE